MRIGNGANTPVRYVTSDPDGVLTAQRGTLAIDRTTGVTWKNQDGGTRWQPSDIPDGGGLIVWLPAISNSWLTFTAIGAGTSSSAVAPDASYLGYRRITVTAAGADAETVTLAQNAFAVLLGGGKIWSKWSFRIPTLSDGTNNIVIRLGMGDATTFADHVDGVYIEYDFATYGDHKWRLCASSNSVRTKTDTGIVAVANTLINAEIVVNAAGDSVTARIGGVAAATPVTTNLPSGASRNFGVLWGMALKQLGAGALMLDINGAGFKTVFTTPQTF